MFFKFKQDKAQKNREYEMERAKVYANTMMQQGRYLASRPSSNAYLQTPMQNPTTSSLFKNSTPPQSYRYESKETQSLLQEQFPGHIVQDCNE